MSSCWVCDRCLAIEADHFGGGRDKQTAGLRRIRDFMGCSVETFRVHLPV